MEKEKNYNRRTEKDYNWLRTLYYMSFLFIVVWPVTKFMYNLKVEGRENLSGNSHVIYAANHVSYIDPPLVSMATIKTVAFMAKQELFHDKDRLLRFLVHTLGAFAVNRDKPEIATFKTVKSIFNTSWSLGIFPQGKIVKDNTLSQIHKGFVLFAKKFKVDVVPIGICGFDGYAKKLFEKHITVKIGTPISYTLSENEIIMEWARQICELTGYENKVEIEESLPEQVTV